MSPEEFKELVEKYNMEVISQDTIYFEPVYPWNGSDCITMFRKPL